VSWPTAKLSAVAPAVPLDCELLDQEEYWLLNLDQVESHSGRVLAKVRVSTEEMGSSINAFGDKHVLYSKLRPNLNKVVVPDEAGFCTSELVPLLPNPKKLDRKYLAYYLRSDDFVSWAVSKTAGAKMPRLNMKLFGQHEIPLPPLATQKHIARVLEQADQLRKQAQQMEGELNQLAQSLFLEMFGDPVTNPMDWESGTIDDIAVPEKGAVRCGPFGTQLKVHEIVDSGIPLLGIENVMDDQLQDNFEKFLTPSKAKELKAFSVRPGDVLITRMGTIGRACVVPDSMGEARISYHLFRVRVDENKCLPKFLLATISRSGTFQQQLSRLAHGAIMAGLNTGVLRQVKFLIPPKKMQEDYIRASDKIEALKKSNENRAQELNAAFQALMQRAFKGDLTAPGSKAA